MASSSHERAEQQWLDARERYERLFANGVGNRIDRADVLFNLGVIQDRLGERDAAIAKLLSALETNPLLEPARDRLESFGVLVPKAGATA